ncbi:MAG: type II toxin-antitoxin system RelE/ParE family toxin [Flavobacteriaceae bacterium]|nr:type II toxin-antitoxin system RelE/ParE family toxin [Flavobacteriaceae bacterium]
MFSYKLSLEAENDITRLYEYGFYKFGITQADKYYDMLFECFDKIASNPHLFPSANHIKTGFRSCVCGVDTIYYTIKENYLIEIITIISRQDFPK